MPFYLKMSQKINSTRRHLNFGCIFVFTNILWTGNETKCKNYIQLDQLKKIKRTKSSLKGNIDVIK